MWDSFIEPIIANYWYKQCNELFQEDAIELVRDMQDTAFMRSKLKKQFVARPLVIVLIFVYLRGYQVIILQPDLLTRGIIIISQSSQMRLSSNYRRSKEMLFYFHGAK